MKSMAKGTLYGSGKPEGEARAAVRNERTPSEKEKPLEELEKMVKKSGTSKISTDSTDLKMSGETISDKILQYDTIEKVKKRESSSPPSP